MKQMNDIWIGLFDMSQIESMTNQEVDKLLALVKPESERVKISKFYKLIDKKRSLAAHLLCRYKLPLIFLSNDQSQGNGNNNNMSDIEFGRSKEGKPFLQANKDWHQIYPIINFNYSHSGGHVFMGVIGSRSNKLEESHVIGVDVESIKELANEEVEPFLQSFESIFTPHEWNNQILNCCYLDSSVQDTNQHKLERFFIHWTLKESFIKAIGMGFGFEPNRAELHFEKTPNSNPKSLFEMRVSSIIIDGSNDSNWHFQFSKTHDGKHVIAVCIGTMASPLLAPHYKDCIIASSQITQTLSEEDPRREKQSIKQGTSVGDDENTKPPKHVLNIDIFTDYSKTLNQMLENIVWPSSF